VALGQRQTTPSSVALASLWIGISACIPTLSIFGRNLQYRSMEMLSPSALSLLLGGLVVVAVIGALWWVRVRSLALPYWHLLWFLPIFLIAPFFVPHVVERLHFLLFGLFGGMTALLFRPWVTLALCLTASIGDEILQHFLADRVGDVRDVYLNAGVSLAAAAFVLLVIRSAGRESQN
jgi:hypothetical protein